MDNLARSALRSAKNYTQGFSDVQVKVREATSNDPWGASSTLLMEISDATFNGRDFLEIMDLLDKRLNDSGRNWRHVFKALTLLDYLIHCGSEQVIAYARQNLYVIKTLKEFQFTDEEGKDQGVNVREKSKAIANLLADDERLKEERKARGALRERMGMSPPIKAPRSQNEEESHYERALEESRRMEQERRQREKEREEREVARALELSQRQSQQVVAPQSSSQAQASIFGGKPQASQQPQVFQQQPSQASMFAQQQMVQRAPPQQQQIDLWGDQNVDQKKQDLDFFGSMAAPQAAIQTQPDPFGFSPQQQYGQPPQQAQPSTQSQQVQPFAQSQQFQQAPFGQSQQFQGQQIQQQPQQSTALFDSAFDGGAGQKNLVPRHLQDNPNAALANIARNAIQIDPFANLASKSNGNLNASQNDLFNNSGGRGANPPLQSQAVVPFGASAQQQQVVPFGAQTAQSYGGPSNVGAQPGFSNQLSNYGGQPGTQFTNQANTQGQFGGQSAFGGGATQSAYGNTQLQPSMTPSVFGNSQMQQPQQNVFGGPQQQPVKAQSNDPFANLVQFPAGGNKSAATQPAGGNGSASAQQVKSLNSMSSQQQQPQYRASANQQGMAPGFSMPFGQPQQQQPYVGSGGGFQQQAYGQQLQQQFGNQQQPFGMQQPQSFGSQNQQQTGNFGQSQQNNNNVFF